MNRYVPIRDCTFNGRLWSPSEDRVLVAEKANKHFKKIGTVVSADEGIDSLSEEERAGLIVDAVGKLDKDNTDLWTGDGKPKVDAVEQAVEFDTTRKEIEAALSGSDDKDMFE